MGRKRDAYIRDYFEWEGQYGKCKACGKDVQQNFTTNLKMHLQRHHPDLFQQHATKNFKSSSSVGDSKDTKTKFSFEMSQNEIINACIDFVTKESLPLSFFDSEPFKAITSQIFKGLNMNKITSDNIMQFAEEKLNKSKCFIKEILSGKLICLKIDTATRSDRAVLCINAQIFLNGKIEIITLAMEEIRGRHSAENIKMVIEEVMRSYNIKKEQVYAITSDNGRNLIKAVALLSETDCDDDESEYTESEEYPENDYGPILGDDIISVKCAAHTLQLAVKDFLDSCGLGVIDRAREVVKLLRTPLLRTKIKEMGVVKPQLNVPTRWSSCYNMINRLCQLREFCSENLSVVDNLCNRDWVLLENIVNVLELPFSLTLKLQQIQLLLGDFYKYWLEMMIKLKRSESTISKQFLSCVENRQGPLLDTNTLNAALVLDPRFRRLLSREKAESGKAHLKAVARRLYNLKEDHNTPTQDTPPHRFDVDLLVDESSVQSSSSILRSGIRELELENSSSDEDSSYIQDELKKAFAEIDVYKEKRLDVELDIVEYWNSKKYSFPWLRRLAFAIHSVPATQVSVERAFSALKLILTDLRYNLSEQNMQTICLLKLNRNIIQNI